MRFHEWVDQLLGRWSTEARWCEANPGVKHVTPADMVALGREFCRTMPDHAAADFHGMPADVVAEVSAVAAPAIDTARRDAMRRLYGPRA